MSTAHRDSLAKIDPEDYVPTTLMILNNRWASGASDLYIRLFDLGINEWRSLSVVFLVPGCTASTIVERIGIHKTVVSRSVRALESKKYVNVKLRSGRQTLHLTPSGERIYHQIAEIALERAKHLLSGFSATEATMLKSLLARLVSNLETLDKCSPTIESRSK